MHLPRTYGRSMKWRSGCNLLKYWWAMLGSNQRPMPTQGSDCHPTEMIMTSTKRCTKGPTIKIKGTTMMYARRKLSPQILKKPGPKPRLYAMTTPVTKDVVTSAMMMANSIRFAKLVCIGNPHMVDDHGFLPAVNRNQLPQGEKFIKRVAVDSAQPNWDKRDTTIALVCLPADVHSSPMYHSPPSLSTTPCSLVPDHG